jgi:hypothetical protein
MTPFLHLRLWWRRSGSTERLGVVVGVLVAVSLVAWAITPTRDDVGSTAANLTTVGATPGAPADTTGSTTTTPLNVAVGGPSASSPAAVAGSSSGAPSRATGDVASNCPATKGRGITDKTILVDVSPVDLGGDSANHAAGAPSASEQQRFVQSLIDDVNARGGLACRKVTAKFHSANPLSPASTHAACLDLLADAPAAVIDFGGLSYANSYDCVPQQKVPLITPLSILPSEVKSFAPYLASPVGDLVTAARDAVYGLKEQGFFDPGKGFKKLGLLEDQCMPEVTGVFEQTLSKIGITNAQISRYSFQCPISAVPSAADIAAAVTQHRGDGATHVVSLTGAAGFGPYTQAAERQGYRPKYAVTDYQSGYGYWEGPGQPQPNPDAFDGSLGISVYSYGVQHTTNVPMDAGTRRCQTAVVKAGFPPEWVFVNGGGGVICSAMWTLFAALGHARSLTPESILPGLFDAGPVELAYPIPNTTFRPPLKLVGGDVWQAGQWHKDCTCWHVLVRNRPSIAP